MHEADPSVKGRPENIYTEEEMLKRLNTIGEDNEEEAQRVRTVDKKHAEDWEEERRRKEEREMEEWDRREAKKGPKMSRGFSWKGVKSAVGLNVR
jgi:hypothetical protein